MPKPDLLQVIKSVFAAGIGVQSHKNREIDFETGSLSHYLIAGLIATILFILVLSFVVTSIIN